MSTLSKIITVIAIAIAIFAALNQPTPAEKLRKEFPMAYHCVMAAADDHKIDREKVIEAINRRCKGKYPRYELGSINLEIIYDEFEK